VGLLAKILREKENQRGLLCRAGEFLTADPKLKQKESGTTSGLAKKKVPKTF